MRAALRAHRPATIASQDRFRPRIAPSSPPASPSPRSGCASFFNRLRSAAAAGRLATHVAGRTAMNLVSIATDRDAARLCHAKLRPGQTRKPPRVLLAPIRGRRSACWMCDSARSGPSRRSATPRSQEPENGAAGRNLPGHAHGAAKSAGAREGDAAGHVAELEWKYSRREAVAEWLALHGAGLNLR